MRCCCAALFNSFLAIENFHWYRLHQFESAGSKSCPEFPLSCPALPQSGPFQCLLPSVGSCVTWSSQYFHCLLRHSDLLSTSIVSCVTLIFSVLPLSLASLWSSQYFHCLLRHSDLLSTSIVSCITLIFSVLPLSLASLWSSQYFHCLLRHSDLLSTSIVSCITLIFSVLPLSLASLWSSQYFHCLLRHSDLLSTSIVSCVTLIFSVLPLSLASLWSSQYFHCLLRHSDLLSTSIVSCVTLIFSDLGLPRRRIFAGVGDCVATAVCLKDRYWDLKNSTPTPKIWQTSSTTISWTTTCMRTTLNLSSIQRLLTFRMPSWNSRIVLNQYMSGADPGDCNWIRRKQNWFGWIKSQSEEDCSSWSELVHRSWRHKAGWCRPRSRGFPRRWTEYGPACKDRRPQLFFPSPTSQIGPAHPRQRGYTRPGVSLRDNQARLL